MPALAVLVGLAHAQEAAAQSCDPPKILLVMDASSSMHQAVGGITKWEAVQSAAEAVFAAHGDAAQYGLMTFPGAAGGCAPGDMLVPMGADSGPTIVSALQSLVIPSDNATPAGQTLMKASQLAELPDYVIFMTDGWQFCDIDTSGAPRCATSSDCALMGVSTCPTCNSCQGGTSDPACVGQNADGCYCVRSWPVLGVEALVNVGVTPFVVGFGSATDVVTLNRAGHASGIAPAGCDPNASTPSCYFQATSPTDLTTALDTIVASLVTETCTGECGIEGTRQCTSSGWTGCDAPDTVACVTDCGTGIQTCAQGELSECSTACGAGGTGGSQAGGAGGTGGSQAGGSGGTGGSAAGGTGGSGVSGSAAGGTGGEAASSAGGAAGSAANGQGGSAASANQDVGDEGACGCRQVGASSSGGFGAIALFGAALLGLRRRRAR